MLPSRLWERDRSLELAADYLSAARQGRGGSLFFLGGAGLGKTALLGEVADAGGDLLVARVRCDPMEAALPFALLSQVVQGLGGRGDEVWGAPVGPGGADTRSATFSRSLRCLEQMASRPVLLTVDDLQWADPDSLACLGFLCRRLAPLPVLVVAALRSSPPGAHDLVQGLTRGGEASLERLAPLTEWACGQVLSERHGPLPAGVAGRAWQVSGGNPLLLGLAAGSLVDSEAGPAHVEELSVPMDTRSLVLGRFADLDPVETAWARAAAVFGTRFRPELVSEVAGLGAGPGETAAEGLWRRGLVRGADDGAAEFVHPLFRQLLYDDLPALVRSRLHTRAFAALRTRGRGDIAAEHAVRGDLGGDPQAIEVLAQEGRRAFRAGAPQTSVDRFEAAVRLSGTAPDAALVADLGRALLEAGRPADAAATLSSLLATELVPSVRVGALVTLARAHFTSGDIDRAGTALQAATALAEPADPGSVVLPLVLHAHAVLMTAGPAAALPIAARALELSDGDRDAEAGAQARATWGMLALWCGDPVGIETARAAGRQLLAGITTRTADVLRSGSGDVLSPAAGAAALAERFEEAEAAFRAGINLADRTGWVNAGASLRIGYGAMLLRTRVADGLAIADELLAMSDLVPVAEPFARAMRTHALLEMGQEAESAAEQELAERSAAPYGLWLCLLRLQHVQGLRLLRSGRAAEASASYSALEQRERQLGVGEPCALPYARHAVVAHVRSGRTEEAERVLAGLHDHAGRLPCRWPSAAASAGAAVLALHRGERLEADAHYRTAVELLSGTSLPLELAEVLIEHGTMLRRDGQVAGARESFRRAAEVAASVGAAWLARRAGEELTAAGGRRRQRREPDRLTPQEQRVVDLAATGASNKDIAAHLFVSVRTVRTHLEGAYRKLGIHSRRELMRRA